MACRRSGVRAPSGPPSFLLVVWLINIGWYRESTNVFRPMRDEGRFFLFYAQRLRDTESTEIHGGPQKDVENYGA